MLRPVGKRLIVKPVEQKQGKLLITKSKPTQFTVISIGNEVTNANPNDVVYLDKFAGSEIEYLDELFLVIDESNILAKIES